MYFARENLIIMQKKFENFASPFFMMGSSIERV